MQFRTVAAFGFALLFTGSAAFGMAADVAPPPAGKGQVVFFRKGGLVGAMISCAVQEKGVKLTGLPPGKFAVVPADPGSHDFSVSGETTDTLRMDVKPGETHFAKCHIGMGVMAGRPKLASASAADFDAIAAKLKPVVQKDMANEPRR